MNNFIESYKIILDQIQSLDTKFPVFIQIRKPKLTNIELIALNLTAEFVALDFELHLFRTIKGTHLENKIERSVYNRRKRNLFHHIESVRKTLANILNQNQGYYIIGSMPAEVCKNARATRSKICKQVEFSGPNRGYCASQKMYYYGYKIHGICSVQGVFQSIDITPASVHDINYLKDVKHQYSNCTLLGDKGYLSDDNKIDLFETARIKLETPMRKSQVNYSQQHYIFRKKRKRIETLFFQPSDQFMIRRNYAKSFLGFKTRIISKITALTVIQYLNKYVFNRPINKIKINLS